MIINFTDPKTLLISLLLTITCYQRVSAQVGSISDKQNEAAALLRCVSEFTACPERKEYMIKQADYVDCLTKHLGGGGTGVDCDRLRPKTDNPPNCPDDAARLKEANVYINACLTSKGFNPSYHSDESAAIERPGLTSDTSSSSDRVTISTVSPLKPEATSVEPADPVSDNATGDAFGLKLKKAVLGQLFDELTKKGMPNADNPTERNRVYVFLVAKKNVTTYVTNLLPVQKYSDGTWPFTKDVKQRFANAVGMGLPNVAFAGFFDDSLAAQQAHKDYTDKVAAYGINRLPVAFQIEPDLNSSTTTITDDRAMSTGRVVTSAKATKVINLPDITVAGKYRPSLGIMPIIDTETTLNQQFLVYQYLKDNPLILNTDDTLQASLTDYRANTQFAIGGTMTAYTYSLKLWQKDKPLAEIVIGFDANIALENRMTSIGRQIGRILSGDTDNYRVQASPRTRNLYDVTDVVKSEVHKGTEVSTLLPDATTIYMPSGLDLPGELNHLVSRVNNLPYLKNPTPNGMAQLVRGVYQQADEKQFFFTNGNIPSAMKDAVRKITQPTSRRVGSILSYVAVGDAFLNTELNLDGAACSYYSALLLAPNLAGSPMEKAAVKRLIYQRMKRVAETRQQPYLAGMFGLAADLNESYLNSPLARLAHQEYYTGISNAASACLRAETQAREIRAQQRKNTFAALATIAGGVAQASSGRSFSEAEINQLGSQIADLSATTQQSQSVFAESFKDMKYEKFEVRTESGEHLELNDLYLNLEIQWHLGLRQDQIVVGKQLLAYAADKPNLRVALEEYLSETDAKQQAASIGEFRNCFKYIEEHANSYESWGKKLPKKVIARF